jgi:hypothetical protein
MPMKEIEDNKDEYIRILVEKNEKLQKRLDAAGKIWREQEKEIKELQRRLEELEEFLIVLY